MKALLILLIAFTAALALAQTGNERVLFDGKSLDGWAHVGPGSFDLEDGALKTTGGMGLLWYTKEKFGNCVIHVEYKVESAKSNSGVFIRIADAPKDPWFAVHHGYEIQIQDDNDRLHRTGAVYSMWPSKGDGNATEPAGIWNDMDIELDGQRIFVTLNGQLITQFDPVLDRPPKREHDWEPERGKRPPEGYIGLQNHSDSDVVWFRAVTVRPLERRAHK